MVLDERDGGVERLDRLRFVFYHNLLILLFYIHILTNHHIRTQPKHQAYDEADTYLSHNLVLTLQSVFVALEYLDVIVQESQESQPYRRDNHQDDIGVTHSAEQKHRYEDTHDDNDTSHRGHSLLFYSKGIDTRIAFRLEDAPTFHPLDELLAKPGGDHQGKNQRQQGAERYVGPHV